MRTISWLREKTIEHSILDDTSVGPKPDQAKIIAARATGSRKAWKSKTREAQRNLTTILGPNIQVPDNLDAMNPAIMDTPLDIRSPNIKPAGEKTEPPKGLVQELHDLGFKETNIRDSPDDTDISTETLNKKIRLGNQKTPMEGVEMRKSDELKFEVLD